MECLCLPDGSWRQVVEAACRLVVDPAATAAVAAAAAALGGGSSAAGAAQPHVLVAVRGDGYGKAGEAPAAAAAAGAVGYQRVNEPELGRRLRPCSR
jgi:hypothetical protein